MTDTSVTMYTTSWCGWCERANALLRSRGIDTWTEIDVDALPGGKTELLERTGGETVPQIYIGDRKVGGFDDLEALDRAGELESALGM